MEYCTLHPVKISKCHIFKKSIKNTRFIKRNEAKFHVRSCAEINTKKIAAIHAVDNFVKSGHIIGLGTGEMSHYVYEYLKECIKIKTLNKISCIPMSSAAASEAAFHGIPQSSIVDYPNIDVAFQEVDAVDSKTGSFLFGRRSEPHQPQITKTRFILSRCKECIGLVESDEKVMERLSGWIPVVIKGQTWEDTSEEIDNAVLGDAEIWRRPTEGTANPRGGESPYVSNEGHNIIDIRFYDTLKLNGEECGYKELSNALFSVEGVVTHGLVIDTLTGAVIASPEGPTIIKWEKEWQQA